MIYVLNHHAVHLKYLVILFVHYALAVLNKEEKRGWGVPLCDGQCNGLGEAQGNLYYVNIWFINLVGGLHGGFQFVKIQVVHIRFVHFSLCMLNFD